MPSERLRRRAGADGAANTTAEVEGKKATSRASQGDVLSPTQLRFGLDLPGGAIEFSVPTEFTIGEILHRRVMEDIESYGRLVIAEFHELAPDVPVTEIFSKPVHLEAALSRSNVSDFLRRIVARVARVIDVEEGESDRVSTQQLEAGLSLRDTLTLAVWYFKFFVNEAAKRVPKKSTGTT